MMDYYNNVMFFPDRFGGQKNIHFGEFRMMTVLSNGNTLIIDDENGTTVTGVKAQDLINILYDEKYSKQGEQE